MLKRITKFLLVYSFVVVTVSSCILQGETFIEPKPEVLEATNIGPYSFTANWTKVVGVDKYVLQVIDDTQSTVAIDSSSENFLNVEKLEVDRLYRYQVWGILRGAKLTPLSEWQEVKTKPESGIPIAYKATDRTPFEFTVNWKTIPGILLYTLRIATDSSMQNIIFTNTINSGTGQEGTASIRIRLNNFEQKYFYQVAAVERNKISDYSNIIEVPAGVGPNCRLTSLTMSNDSQNETKQEFSYDQSGRLIYIYPIQ